MPKRSSGQLSLFKTSTNTEEVKILTVSELTSQIQNTLENKFDQVTVTGEISNAKIHQSGHWYFSLKDKEATLPCICFKARNQNIKFQLQDGIAVVAKGKLSVWPPSGAYRLSVDNLAPVGIGDWQLAFEQLKNKLESEGLLDIERKKAIPILPRVIGIATSQTGAAIRDILTALTRRNPKVQVIIAPCRVQGEGSPEEIVEAIKLLNGFENIDVIIVARGGGSIEDLWSFNTEIVARAVTQSKIPIISGIGHETDLTICDLVSDLRAPTPTAAAELVSKGREELIDKHNNLYRRINTAIEFKLSKARNRLVQLSPKHTLARHDERLKKLRILKNSIETKLITKIDLFFTTANQKFITLHEKMIALSAENVLKRGFSILQNSEGHILNNVKSLSVGQKISARLYSGSLKLSIEEIIEENK